MPSTFSGLYICLRAMHAHQLSLETSAHNIANARTDGFTRQRTVLSTTPPWPVPSINSSGMVGQVGTGVDVSKIQRLRDQFLDVQIRRENGILGEWSIKQDTLERIEVIFQEPTDTGLNMLLTQFWDSWLQLSMDPEETQSAVRTTLVETAVSLCDALRHTDQQLDALSDDLDSIIDIKVDRINSIAQQISDLNNQIKKLKLAGFEPNDLMDQRDLLLDELSKIIDFKAEEKEDGTINVDLHDLTSGSSHSLVAGESKTDITVDNAEDFATSGELKGLFNSKEMLDQYKEDLETFVANLITEVNAQHTQGYDIDGEPGQSFFWGEPAADFIEVNPNIKSDVSKIAAASAPDGGPGDGSNALAISRLRYTKGFDDLYRNMIAELGVETNEAQRMAENQEVLVGQLEDRKESISGVSIDEELAHMIEYQHSYQAAARFLTTMDELLDTLINRTAI